MYPAILFMILVAFAVFCLINAKRIIWNFEKSSLGRPLSETPPLKWRILLALLFLIASAFTAFTAYILLGDTLLGVAPCVVAIGMGHELRNFRAQGILGQPAGRVWAPRPTPSTIRISIHSLEHRDATSQPSPQPSTTQPSSSVVTVRISSAVRNVRRQDCGFMGISTLSATSPQPS